MASTTANARERTPVAPTSAAATTANVCVVGTGYVGLTTAVCLAELGHDVAALDIDAVKIAALQNGVLPFHEPGLGALTARAVAGGRLRFTTDYAEGLAQADFAYMAVPTPMGLDGEADLVFVRQAVKAMADAMSRPVTIVNKSTVPIGTGDLVSRIVREHVQTPPRLFGRLPPGIPARGERGRGLHASRPPGVRRS